MAERNTALQTQTLISNFVKEYNAGFEEFKERTKSSMLSDDVFNQAGIILILNTLDSLKDTMNPVGHIISDKYLIDSRGYVGKELTNLNNSLFVHHDKYIGSDRTESEMGNFLHRLLTSAFSFHDAWAGRYKKLEKGQGLRIVIKIKHLYLGIFNLFFPKHK